MLAVTLPGVAETPAVVQLVLIIDDVGNHRQRDLRALQLPGRINLAILPHTSNATTIANMASAAGKEVLLHAPMSTVDNHHLGPGALTSAMTELDFRATLAESLRSTPHVRGVSNHMGSALTEQVEPMSWLMEELDARGLYFVDSRTSVNTVAAATARQHRIPVLSRQVFLDNDRSPEAIAERFEEFLRRGREQGIAVAIGHPHSNTLDYLQQVLPELEARGYQLLWISEALHTERYNYSRLPSNENHTEQP
ncbi:divergent polysaccharide deacetylase family protein [Candidatus Litorirhabdus singularis]|nr:divergent polysaccharide deacetylase family protein [Candidatus Litorirhabdus singularis]